MINYNLHEETISNAEIPKSAFYKHRKFINSDKKLFTNDIKNIILLNKIDSESTGINIYENGDEKYTEIKIFQINLKNKNSILKISKIMFSLILEPLLIEFRFENYVCFSIADSRINQKDEDKNIVEHIYTTNFIRVEDEWIYQLDFDKFNWSNSNLKSLHNYIKDIVIIKLLNDEGISSFDSIKIGLEKLDKLRKLKSKINKLTLKIKSEKQFNKKADLADVKRKLEKESISLS